MVSGFIVPIQFDIVLSSLRNVSIEGEPFFKRVSLNITCKNFCKSITLKNDADIEKSVNYALEHDVTVVAAAGDYGDKDLLYPAKYEGVISVQGLDSNLNLWSNSNHEDTATLTFPCENIESIDISNDSSLFKSTSSGTSQATALASAYIALIKDYYLDSYDKKLTNIELIDTLKEIDTFKNSNKEYLKPFSN